MPVPTAEQPVPFVFLGGLEQDIGASVGGLPPTPAEEMRRLLVGALARAHFIETKVGGPMPAIVIFYTWGTANLDTFEQIEVDSETGTDSNRLVDFNGREMARLVGINKAGQRLMSSAVAGDLNDALLSERFYIFVAALDAKALLRREKKLVWRTRISIAARRTTLAESMGVMLASAAPYFGRNEARPVFVDDTLRRKVEVKMGDIQVIESDVSAPDSPRPKSRP
ncbi:hypothetical protein ESB00_11000 [Oleiharenicola lentus]|uniref:Uncharacterized protein n=1 Tax=Oleiharenicola lentus TaxID=2508720 RepID=A0A4Q1CB87_9BACT|nr:hypothetical protein ESB00_11000 [Oleiharenicola lentus]